MKLYIKNMVCDRCKTIVQSEIEKIGFQYNNVGIGVVNTEKQITSLQRSQFDAALKKHGFELINDQNNELIDKLKIAITELEVYSDEDLKISFTDFIGLSADDNFISLNKLFAEIEGVTIEKYIISHKIARVKELLVYDDLSLSEIAKKMHYSNTAKLSSQFRRITGLTPTHFRQLRNSRILNPELN
ncbi:MAG: AraC family transcriptional regulator [Bacteroidales bacterium]|nr:AraC family transcriptional regulator [Bacteroidales bacterium]